MRSNQTTKRLHKKASYVCHVGTLPSQSPLMRLFRLLFRCHERLVHALHHRIAAKNALRGHIPVQLRLKFEEAQPQHNAEHTRRGEQRTHTTQPKKFKTGAQGRGEQKGRVILLGRDCHGGGASGGQGQLTEECTTSHLSSFEQVKTRVTTAETLTVR